MGGFRGGGQGVRTIPLKNQENVGFLSNTGPYPLKNHKATKPAFNVGPSSARQRNAFIGVPAKRHKWRLGGGPIMARLYRYHH